MIRVRHTDAWVGLLVLAAIAVLLVAILQAGFLRDWFKPTSELRLVLPATGVAGLEVGADVEVLGTKAGIVRRIVLEPDQQMYAMIEIDDQATAFVRRDSAAIIRRRFGVAGAAFVDISRGTGEELDWSYAVIEATTERAPTDSINAMIDEVRGKVFPILDNAGRATQALAEIMERINRGEGNVGRVLVDQTLMQQAEATVESANQAVAGLNQLLAQLQKSAGDVNELTDKDVPALMNRLQAVLRDIAQASTRMPAISRNVEGSTANLPALLTQLQVTTRELDRLVVQLRGSWLLGGSPPPQAPKQFSPSQVLP
jgi:phospholipid/cholesterol/gamma-HCH transport system substrate-binding protein